MNNYKETASQFEKALINLEKSEAQEIIDSVSQELTSLEIVSQIVVPALEQVGNAWQEGSLALSQVYMSGRICEQLIDDLLPPKSEERKVQPKMAIAVLNDFHFLGKRIIHSYIRSAGFEIVDYGRKTVDELVASIMDDEIELIFISTLMYPSALDIRKVKDKLLEVAPHVKVVVGGAPFRMDSMLWQQVGADAMGRDGADALGFINRLMTE